MVTRLLTDGGGLDAIDGVMYLRRRCSGSGVLCLLIGPPGSRLVSAVRLAGRSFGVSHGLSTGAFHAPAGFRSELAILVKLLSDDVADAGLLHRVPDLLLRLRRVTRRVSARAAGP